MCESVKVIALPRGVRGTRRQGRQGRGRGGKKPLSRRAAGVSSALLKNWGRCQTRRHRSLRQLAPVPLRWRPPGGRPPRLAPTAPGVAPLAPCGLGHRPDRLVGAPRAVLLPAHPVWLALQGPLGLHVDTRTSVGLGPPSIAGIWPRPCDGLICKPWVHLLLHPLERW